MRGSDLQQQALRKKTGWLLFCPAFYSFFTGLPTDSMRFKLCSPFFRCVYHVKRRNDRRERGTRLLLLSFSVTSDWDRWGPWGPLLHSQDCSQTHWIVKPSEVRQTRGGGRRAPCSNPRRFFFFFSGNSHYRCISIGTRSPSSAELLKGRGLCCSG